MFGRKSREIKELKSLLKDNDSIMIARLEGLKKAALEIDGWQRRFSELQAENHKAQTQIIPALVAERDALAKEAEGLRIQNMEVQRTLRQVAENPPDAQAPDALAP